MNHATRLAIFEAIRKKLGPDWNVADIRAELEKEYEIQMEEQTIRGYCLAIGMPCHPRPK